MKTEIRIENCDPTYCVIHTPEENEKIRLLAEKITMMDLEGNKVILNGWDGDFCIPLKTSDIYRIYSMEKKVFVETKDEILLLKMRLYEFEDLIEKCGLSDFIRVSNTDIVNFEHVKNLDTNLTGIIRINFTNNKTSIVSRRYMNKIRRQLCLKK